jgi:dipeptidyl aminopeptidase/acylaminoacyl peptidase
LCLLLVAAAGCGRAERASGPAELRSALQVPQFRNPLAPALLRTWRQPGLVFEQVQFQGRYGQFIPALICYPELGRSRRLPAVLCMPGSPNRKEDLLQPLDLLPRWADQGFFLMSIDRPYHGERGGDLAAAIRQKGLARVWGEYVYDLMRAVDYLQTRPEVDGDRIGMLGLSMGGMEALLLAALDTRVQVAVSVGGQLTWEEVFRGPAWKLIFGGLDLGLQLQREGVSGQQAWQRFQQAYPEMKLVDAQRLAPLLAPRPLLLMTGRDDPYVPPDAALRVFEASRPRYQEEGQPDRLALWVDPDTGHGFSTQMQSRALAWFGRWL